MLVLAGGIGVLVGDTGAVVGGPGMFVDLGALVYTFEHTTNITACQDVALVLRVQLPPAPPPAFLGAA